MFTTLRRTPLIKEFLFSLLFSIVIASASVLYDSKEFHSELHSYISDYCAAVNSNCQDRLDELDVIFVTPSDVSELNSFGADLVSSKASPKFFSEADIEEIDERASNLFQMLGNPDSGISTLTELLINYTQFLLFACTMMYMIGSTLVTLSRVLPYVNEVKPKISVFRAAFVPMSFAIYVSII
ncbi:hypothetical protein [Vibrio crassostreae]|uniref:hypothetical protein n=1 Tax=Vibrio crassostreae TaxID=246167 RepID=UPI001B30A572|nr:hypothetical protein [Vibrio crassostreae]